MKSAILSLVIACACLACDIDTVCVSGGDDVGTECPRAGATSLDVDNTIDCEIRSCEVDSTLRARCEFAIWIPDGDVGEIGVRLPGGAELPWNELPWNADAGAFEDPFVVGEGVMCGSFSLTLTEPTVEYIEISCTNWTASGFTFDQEAL